MGQKELLSERNEYIDFEELFILLPNLKTVLDEDSVFLFTKELYLLSELIYIKSKNEKEIGNS